MAKNRFEWVRDAEEPVTPNTHRPTRREKRQGSIDAERVLERLCARQPSSLTALDLDGRIVDALAQLRSINPRNHGAVRRQRALLKSMLQHEDLQALEAALEHHTIADSGVQPAVERWRARLLDEVDPAIDAFVEAHPTVDRQQLRRLVREVRRHPDRPRPSKHLRRLLSEAIRGQ